MSSLKGYVHLIRNEEIDKQGQAELTNELAKNTEYTSNLVDNLLLWAKTQMQGQRIVLTEQDIKEILQEIILEIGLFADSKAIKIDLSCQENVLVNTDKNLLAIAIRNIIANSIKFSYMHGRIVIQVSREQKFCKIVFNDYGKGISPENLEKIHKSISFSEKGTQLEKGTGLGLMLVKQFLRQVGGEFAVESKVGEGTRITLMIPLSKPNY